MDTHPLTDIRSFTFDGDLLCADEDIRVVPVDKNVAHFRILNRCRHRRRIRALRAFEGERFDRPVAIAAGVSAIAIASCSVHRAPSAVSPHEIAPPSSSTMASTAVVIGHATNGSKRHSRASSS